MYFLSETILSSKDTTNLPLRGLKLFATAEHEGRKNTEALVGVSFIDLTLQLLSFEYFQSFEGNGTGKLHEEFIPPD